MCSTQKEWIDSYISAVDSYAGYELGCEEHTVRPNRDTLELLRFAVDYCRHQIDCLDIADTQAQAEATLQDPIIFDGGVAYIPQPPTIEQ